MDKYLNNLTWFVLMMIEENYILFNVDNDFSPQQFVHAVLRNILKAATMLGNVHSICYSIIYFKMRSNE